MRINSILRTGLVALALSTGFIGFTPAFAADMPMPMPTAQSQASNFSPYDGPTWEVAKQVAATQAY